MKKRIYEIIEKAESKDILSAIYDYFMMLTIVVSLVPLAFKDSVVYLRACAANQGHHRKKIQPNG